jgi:hypothetical protein
MRWGPAAPAKEPLIDRAMSSTNRKDVTMNSFEEALKNAKRGVLQPDTVMRAGFAICPQCMASTHLLNNRKTTSDGLSLVCRICGYELIREQPKQEEI